jgi:hypothetical protein
MERLTERDAEREHEEHEEDSDPPADQILPASTPTSRAAFDGCQCAHGS